ncbi:sodium:proton antiporter [Candidatus Sumerlaeota bacterium]|nr:sodium:proton antiporter [Candidatus Sumerlaeota bacterium]
MTLLAASQVPTPLWAVTPFALLLILIATGPLFFHHWWEHNYPKVAIGLGVLVAIYLLFLPGGAHHLVETGVEYASFISLIGSLFIISGGILIRIQGTPTPLRNTAILAIGGALANILGTTGAAMLLVRPFLRFNEGRMKPYLVVFFIFIVCNLGGALTPIGDPPLFLGYLRGVPFFWMLENFSFQWLIVMGAILTIFFLVDRANKALPFSAETSSRPELDMQGFSQILFLLAILGLVLVQKAEFLHSFHHFVVGPTVALLMGIVAYSSLRMADKTILKENEFDFAPLKEVAILFIGIFLTMIPALQALREHAPNLGIDKPWKFYLSTGALSAVLDNAPTYLCFLTVAAGLHGYGIDDPRGIPDLLSTSLGAHDVGAISLGAVFWGAATYIGNGPNFMVRNIAASMGANPPDFLTYVFRYSLVYLLPVLLLVLVML